MSVKGAQEKIETWRQDYNHFRPHSSLNNMTPFEYAVLHQNNSPNNFSNGV
jgi:putative transposase